MTTTALSEVLAEMRAEECKDRAQLSSHVRVWANRIESALASAEPVAWYAPSIDDTCTAAKKAQRERDIPETARLFTVPLYTNAQPAAKVEALCSDCPPVGYPTDATRCTPCPRNSPTPASVPDGFREHGNAALTHAPVDDQLRQVDGLKVVFIRREYYAGNLPPGIYSGNKNEGDADVVVLLDYGKKPADVSDDDVRDFLTTRTEFAP